MVLTKPELVTVLQNEVRILLHLASKIDPKQLGYRPTPKQRSTIELLKYLSIMGPFLVQAARTGFDPAAWQAANQAAEARDFDETLKVIAGQADAYARMLADISDAELRSEMDGFDGKKVSRGAFIVNLVVCGCAAYRTQLFMYLKAGGREELGTINLWAGVDAPPAATPA
jgi:hypothetical protein